MYLQSFSEGAPSHTCGDCGRSFVGSGPLNFHLRSCRRTKRRLQGALAKAKALWEARKRSKKHPLLVADLQGVGSTTSAPPSQIPPTMIAAILGNNAGESPPPPVEPSHAPAASTQNEPVCRDLDMQAAGVDHSGNFNLSRLWPLCLRTVPLMAPRACRWQKEGQGVRTDNFRFDTRTFYLRLSNHSHHHHQVNSTPL